MTDNVYEERLRTISVQFVDPFGTPLFTVDLKVPASMVTNVRPEFVNSMNLETMHNPDFSSQVRVILR